MQFAFTLSGRFGYPCSRAGAHQALHSAGVYTVSIDFTITQSDASDKSVIAGEKSGFKQGAGMG